MHSPIPGSVLVLVSCHRCRRLHEAPLTDASNPTCAECAAETTPPPASLALLRRPRLR